jgi:hypothetical protein
LTQTKDKESKMNCWKEKYEKENGCCRNGMPNKDKYDSIVLEMRSGNFSTYQKFVDEVEKNRCK